MPHYGQPPAPPSNHWSPFHRHRSARSVPQLGVNGSVFGFLSRELHLCGGVAVHLCSVRSFLLLRTDVLVWPCHSLCSHLCDLYLVVFLVWALRNKAVTRLCTSGLCLGYHKHFPGHEADAYLTIVRSCRFSLIRWLDPWYPFPQELKGSCCWFTR